VRACLWPHYLTPARPCVVLRVQAHYNMNDQWEAAINFTNIIVTAIFVVEMCLK